MHNTARGSFNFCLQVVVLNRELQDCCCVYAHCYMNTAALASAPCYFERKRSCANKTSAHPMLGLAMLFALKSLAQLVCTSVTAKDTDPHQAILDSHQAITDPHQAMTNPHQATTDPHPAIIPTEKPTCMYLDVCLTTSKIIRETTSS